MSLQPELQHVIDQLEIQQLPITYANAIDTKNFDALDDVFTPDAYIDYRAFGGPDGKYPTIKKFLQDALPNFPHFMHLVGNVAVKISGDTATGRTACFNPMVCKLADGAEQIMYIGLWYHDKYARTPKGWRFVERIEERCYVDNAPEGLSTASN
jgi:hypothetical protein